MEIKNSGLRMRAVVAVLVLMGLGLVATHHRSGTPASQSSEERQSPEEAAGLRPVVSLGKSTPDTVSAVSQPAPSMGHTVTATREMRETQSKARLKYLDHCAHVECPGFDQTEASSYDLDVNKQIAAELEEYAKLVGATKESEEVARYFLQTGNDDIKEAAMDLLALSPINETNMRIAFRAMSETSSAPLTKSFLHSAFAQACSQRDYAPICASWVRERMRRGGENVQKTLARYSLEITNAYTASLFAKLEKTEAQRDPFSLKTRYLRANNAEFGRLQRGG